MSLLANTSVTADSLPELKDSQDTFFVLYREYRKYLPLYNSLASMLARDLERRSSS